MTTIDLKGQLLARRGNAKAKYQDAAQKMALLEADLITARRQRDEASGEMAALDNALALLGQCDPSLQIEPPAPDAKATVAERFAVARRTVAPLPVKAAPAGDPVPTPSPPSARG